MNEPRDDEAPRCLTLGLNEDEPIHLQMGRVEVWLTYTPKDRPGHGMQPKLTILAPPCVSILRAQAQQRGPRPEGPAPVSTPAPTPIRRVDGPAQSPVRTTSHSALGTALAVIRRRKGGD